MRMTFTELTRVTRPTFVPIRWPTVVADAASPLIDALEQLTAGRAGSLIGHVLAVVSSRPDDFVLARLLACCGANVHFLCPAAPVWQLDVHGPLFRRLSARLERERPDLDVLPLRDIDRNNFTRSEKFTIEAWPATELASRCAFVFAHDLLDEQRERAARTLESLAALTCVGGAIELFGESRTAAVLDELVQQTGLLGLGAAAAVRSADSWEAWRLALRRLSGPNLEFPRSDEDPPTLLAHCEARLRFAAPFARGAAVLEAGCGSGLGARLFRKAGAVRVVGLDYSPEALDRARAEIRDDRLAFREWDLNCTPLPFDDACFDLVVCLEVLEHLYRQEELIAEFVRILRPGGRLILSVPDREIEEHWISYNQCRNIYHVRVPTRAELARLLAPFAEVRYARQVDLIGSLVMRDDAGGDFVFQSCEGQASGQRSQTVAAGFSLRPPQAEACGYRELNSRRSSEQNPALAILAECVKSPIEAARPVQQVVPHLRLHDNFLTTQLALQQQVRQLERERDEERRRRWSEGNRAALEIDHLRNKASGIVIRGEQKSLMPLSEERAVRAWIHGDAEAYTLRGVSPGPWLVRLEDELAAAEALPPPCDLPSGPWLLEPDDFAFLLSPLVEAPTSPAAVFFPLPEWRVGLARLRRWDRTGATEVWFREADGWKQCDLRAVVARRLFDWLTRRTLFRAARWFGLDRPETQTKVMLAAMRFFRRRGIPEVRHRNLDVPDDALWPEWVVASDHPRRLPEGRPLKVVQYTWSLAPGGTERQLCNLAAGLVRRGVDVRVLTDEPLAGEWGHYAELLRAAGVPMRAAARSTLQARAAHEIPWHLLRAVPAELRQAAINLTADLAADPPDVLHCWLDRPNVLGTIAGLLADVPLIVLSTRNANPTNFPRIHSPYLREWYRTAALSDRVRLVANSHSGAASYAAWLGIPVERFRVVLNGVCLDHFPRPTPQARRTARTLFDLRSTDKVVCGIFRLAAEKQPELFLEVVRRVKKRVPELHVLLAGVGDLAGRIASLVQSRRMGRFVSLLGRRQDISNVFLAADASLLTSTLEGCPNAALESQHLGVPVVATAGGGTVDAVDDGVTGFLSGVTDAEALADQLTRVLTDDDLRARMAAAGPEFVASRFGLDRMVEETRAIYEPRRSLIAENRADFAASGLARPC